MSRGVDVHKDAPFWKPVLAETCMAAAACQCAVCPSPDKRTDPWLLVYSPIPVAFIFLLYLGVVWLGPRIMRKRQPVDLKAVLMVYNFGMVGLSAYMFHEVRDVHGSAHVPVSVLLPV